MSRLASLTLRFAAGAAVALSAPALAQDIAITNARLVIGDGSAPVDGGTVVVRGGRVVAAGAGVAVPAGVPSVDAGGKYVTPGLVAGFSRVGLVEVSAVDGTEDANARTSIFSAALDIAPALNPLGTPVAVNRVDGVTRALVYPGNSSGLFAGRGALVDLGADRDMVTRAGLFQYVEFGEEGAERAGGSRAATFLHFRALLQEARDYGANRAAYDKGEGRDLMVSRLDLEALVPVVQGKSPLLIRVSSANDIRQVLKLAREEKLSIVLERAEEGWRVASELAAAKVPVIIDSQAALPASFETLGTHLRNAQILFQAGVQVSIMGSRDYNNLRQSRMNAGTAVAHGLPYQAALAAITLNPAKIWGADQEIGSIEPGKAADVVIWSGDPLEGQSYPIAVYIAGQAQPMTSRSTELAARYKPSTDNIARPAYRN